MQTSQRAFSPLITILCRDDMIFNFKHFSISHGASSMKVGTDGVLLGAWTPVESAQCVWDVGCGSALIALMIAQRSDANITGFEIDSAAAREAMENSTRSPWCGRVTVLEGDVFHLASTAPVPDLIVCNPPFFTETLQSPEKRRALARHEGSLGLESLIRLASERLAPGGGLAFVAPWTRNGDVELWGALYGLEFDRRLEVKSHPDRAPMRSLWFFKKGGECHPQTSVLTLRDENGEWSGDYIALTKDFYTHLK